MRIDLTDLVGEYNYRGGVSAVTSSSRPVYSTDQATWTHFDDRQVAWNDEVKQLTLLFRPTAATLWIAHVAPYTTRDLESLRQSIGASPYLTTASVGTSVRGREIPLWTITDQAVRALDKQVIWLMARQHAWEAGTSWVIEGAVRFLLSDEPEANNVRRNCVFRIFPMADPDGVAAGAVRFNAHGYDLNRHWDAVDPEHMPEIAAMRRDILDWIDTGRRVDLFLALHNTESADYIATPLETADPSLRALAERLQKGLQSQTAFDDPSGPRDSGLSTTPGAPGRMAVHQGLFHDRRVPALLMELRVEKSPKLGRCPTTADRLQFGAQLVRILAVALQDTR
jgi:murein tripeptide amidase MpaA